MNLSAAIVEQLDANGTLRTFRMNAGPGRPLTVAFANEYEQHRTGPFHFLDERDERKFAEAFAACQVRQLSSSRFFVRNDVHHFLTSWAGIPTKRQYLSYYALCLPQSAVPMQVRFTDPRNGSEFRKVVERDDQRNRFILYLECRSSHGVFDFALDVSFRIDQDAFRSNEFADQTTLRYGEHLEAYKHSLSTRTRTVVQQFFAEGISVGDQYNISGQTGAVGPNSNAEHNTFQQTYQQGLAGVDLLSLANELAALRQAMRKEASELEHDRAIASIAEAEVAARKKDGASVMTHLQAAGKWALDFATKISALLAAKTIENSIGL